MTRINTISAKMLLDQHLVAEKKEINQLAGQLTKSLRSKNWNYSTLPSRFTLGTGHVKFWYLRGLYIRHRFDEVYEECIRRGFKAENNFKDVWKDKPAIFNNDYVPTPESVTLIKERIIDKVNQKKRFYRYEGKYIDNESYIKCLLNGSMDGLEFWEF